MGVGMFDGRPGTRLRGRRTECDVLDRLLKATRTGQSQALVIRGEPGVGKTALCSHLVASASDCRVARAAGVESEMELPFAGLHQLCAPMMGQLGHLPTPQREALSAALGGVTSGDAPDRFMVGLAVLGLLSEVAADRPLVCLVDDAQWLDRESAQALTFAARRLLAESVAMVFVVREPNDGRHFVSLPELTVGGLGESDARELLSSVIPGPLDDRVRDRILAETRGNPLALLELPRGLAVAELAGGFGLPDTRPLTCRIEQHFLRRVRLLPVDTQRLLLVAAAEPVGDLTLLKRAAERLGLGVDAAAAAEAAGLIEFGGWVRFRHPLVRSAIYRASTHSERQEAHRALAETIDPCRNPARCAWHRAQAASGLDEAVAGALEHSADRARRRGGLAAVAAFLARATELTPDPARRSARALAAAQAKFEAGAPDSADDLLAVAELGPRDDLRRARVARLRAQIAFGRNRGKEAPSLLLEAAKGLEGLDDGLARETYLEAFGAALFAGPDGERYPALEVAEAVRVAPHGPQPTRSIDLLLDGMATRRVARPGTGSVLSERPQAGIADLRQALHALRRENPRSKDDIMRFLGVSSMAQSMAAHELWDFEAWGELSTRSVQLARDAGALALLPGLLAWLAPVHVHSGEFDGAAALIEEADTITAATGNAPMRYSALFLLAWKGQEAALLNLVDDAVGDSAPRGEGRVSGLAGHLTAVLYNGLGRYPAALDAARLALRHDEFGNFGWSLAELVEAGVRSGAGDDAAGALRVLEERTLASGTDWGLGVLARSRALVEEGDTAESLYREALERLEHSGVVVHRARAQLVYGEWLRRQNRPRDGREQLRAAYEAFSGMGADAFAERARRELFASGETVRKRTIEAIDVLTAQERQIARLCAEGHTNPEIGGQLFISPRTVEYHLSKMYSKLGVSSRRELSEALRTSGEPTTSPSQTASSRFGQRQQLPVPVST